MNKNFEGQKSLTFFHNHISFYKNQLLRQTGVIIKKALVLLTLLF